MTACDVTKQNATKRNLPARNATERDVSERKRNVTIRNMTERNAWRHDVPIEMQSSPQRQVKSELPLWKAVGYRCGARFHQPDQE